VKHALTHARFFGCSRNSFASSNEHDSSQSKLDRERTWHGGQPFIEGLFSPKLGNYTVGQVKASTKLSAVPESESQGSWSIKLKKWPFPVTFNLPFDVRQTWPTDQCPNNRVEIASTPLCDARSFER
jgi:hypothetical protein